MEKIEKVRVTADLPFDEVDSLRDLAAQQGISMTEALRRAIATEGLLQKRRNDGSRILLEKDGRMSELLFTR